MNRKRKLKTFINSDWSIKKLAIKTFLLCGVARMLILFVPFNKLANHLGTHNTESNMKLDKQQYKIARQIKWLVEGVSRWTPWESKCLVQAIVAQYLLNKRGISSTLYLGVCKDGKNAIQAHAWLRCGEMIVTGAGMYTQFKKVSSFSN